jgi:hypothetical protein
VTRVNAIVAAVSVPARSAASAPRGMTIVEQRLRAGLPARFALTNAFTLVVTLPTGLATAWREADAGALVTAGRFERGRPEEGWVTAPGAAGRPPLWLVLLDTTGAGVTAGLPARRPVAAAAGIAGVPRRLVTGGGQPVGVAVTMLDWEIYAGTVLGAGDFGSWARLAWRPIGKGSDHFDAAPISPRVRARSSAGDSMAGVGVAATEPAGYTATPAITTIREWV